MNLKMSIFALTYWGRNILFVFWEIWKKKPKSHFEINWPLARPDPEIHKDSLNLYQCAVFFEIADRLSTICQFKKHVYWIYAQKSNSKGLTSKETDIQEKRKFDSALFILISQKINWLEKSHWPLKVRLSRNEFMKSSINPK